MFMFLPGSRRIDVEGHVSPGFEKVRDAFAENFARRHELGGAVCAYMTFDITGAARVAATGQLTTLSSPDPLDENSFETPRNIAPVTSTVNGLGPSFRRTLPPYSLSMLRVGTK